MRHRKNFNHLGRKVAHRKAMLANMATSLILHKRITTTVQKAKALQTYVEPIITRSKNDTTHSRRIVFSLLKSKYAISELFREIAVKVADRPGGYTRILKTGNRLGDNADMCIIELVDYNETYVKEAKAAKKPATRRSRKSSGSTPTETPVKATKEVVKESKPEVVEEAVVEAEVIEEVKSEEANVEPIDGETEEPKADDSENKVE